MTVKFRARDYEVKPVELGDVREFIATHHYAGGGSNTGVYLHGLFRQGGDDLLGAAWWLPPTKLAAQATWDGDWRRVLSLTRLAVHPDVPTNGASFLIGRSIREIRKHGDWDCLVTYADDRLRHTGCIYRATNWEYLGMTAPQPAWVDAEGRQVARKRGPRSLTVAEMTERGYQRVGSFAKHKFRMVLNPLAG